MEEYTEEQYAQYQVDNGEYYDESYYEQLGYYDENGEFIYYEQQQQSNKVTIKTDMGDVTYQEVYYNDQPMLVDDEGRILNPDKLNREDPNLTEAYDVFLSGWQKQHMAAVLDAESSSLCIWPNERPPIYLKRFDIYENLSKLCHYGTSDPAESQKQRHSGDFLPVRSVMFMAAPTSLTKTLEIERVAPPLRSRFRMTGGNNRRDVTRWYPAEKVDAFVGTAGSVGTIDYFIDWTDGPDRYYISTNFDPRAGWRRLWRFAAYPVTQYYILSRTVEHTDLESEGGKGATCNIVKGSSVFCRKGWRLIGSFFAFDLELTSSNKYTVYTRKDPFHRLKLTMTEVDNPEEWTEQFSFFAFDIPIPGSCKYELQHCVRSIHTTSASVSRHRLTTEDSKLPWQFRMSIYVFPAAIEDCTISFECDEYF